jgi:nucleotide-binding universal stress UspA family protein
MYKHILVAFDGSEPSKHALDQGVVLAGTLGARITILSVVPRVRIPVFPDDEFGSSPIRTGQDFIEYQEKMKDIYGKSLEDAKTDVEKAFPSLVLDTILLEGRPSSTIVNVAEERDVDLIIIGSRGVGGITGWLLGSTSRKVVEQCTRPILVIK